jgi:tRNA-specific 2-thiouridylase
MRSSTRRSKRIYAVAMSGGVDSSVVAALLQDSGDDVFGITMDIHENCTQDIEDAEAVCKHLGIEHIVFDVRSEYKKKVIDLFVEYYSKGLTPNPCSFCNRDLKLNILVDFAVGKGADVITTGHYAKLRFCGEKVFLSEGENYKKDQSYFVSLAPRDKLRSVSFPLGNISSKDKTRKMAIRFNLPNSRKSDSQDICFIRSGTYKEFLRDFQNGSPLFAHGGIRMHETGELIGEHDGIANYTVGQRKGIGVSNKDPLYVIKIDPSKNEVVVGSRENLNIMEFEVSEVNWILDAEDKFESLVKIRSFGQKSKAVVTKKDEKTVAITLLEESSSPVTRGQVCVMYDDKKHVIGAGIIS